jgi:hypothetical protein
MEHDDEKKIKSGDEYAEGWESGSWDIVNDNKPDLSKRNHASGDPLVNKDKNEIKHDDDSGSAQRGLGGTSDANRGDNSAMR